MSLIKRLRLCGESYRVEYREAEGEKIYIQAANELERLTARCNQLHGYIYDRNARIAELEELAFHDDQLIKLLRLNGSANRDRIAELEAKVKNLRESITEIEQLTTDNVQLMMNAKQDGRRIAKLEAIIKTLYIETSDNWVQQHIKIMGEAVEEESVYYCQVCGYVEGACDGMDGSLMQQCPAEVEE